MDSKIRDVALVVAEIVVLLRGLDPGLDVEEALEQVLPLVAERHPMEALSLTHKSIREWNEVLDLAEDHIKRRGQEDRDRREKARLSEAWKAMGMPAETVASENAWTKKLRGTQGSEMRKMMMMAAERAKENE